MTCTIGEKMTASSARANPEPLIGQTYTLLRCRRAVYRAPDAQAREQVPEVNAEKKRHQRAFSFDGLDERPRPVRVPDKRRRIFRRRSS